VYPILPVSLDCLRLVYPILPVSLDCFSLFVFVLCTLYCQFLWIVFVLCTLYCQFLWIVFVLCTLYCQFLSIVHFDYLYGIIWRLFLEKNCFGPRREWQNPPLRVKRSVPTPTLYMRKGMRLF
jgi:hypothetical protein